MWWGIKVTRRPPHGSINGMAEFGRYIIQYFRKPNKNSRPYEVLLGELDKYSFYDACLFSADLIKNWRASVQKASVSI